MTIKVTCNSFEELTKFANMLARGTLLDQACMEIKDSKEVQPENAGVDPQAQNESIPYGRQIAPHFPNANVPQHADATASSTPLSVSNAQHVVSTHPVPVQSESPQQAQSAVQSPVPAAVPTTPHEYTQDDLARAAMQLMDKGGMQQLQQLLAGYGCETLQQLPKAQYGNFATALRGMGAQI